MSESRKEGQRHIVYCSICQKPQKYISTHLKRAYMSDKTPKERREEILKAKKMTLMWIWKGRRWDYNALKEWCPAPVGRYHLLKRLEEDGFIVLNPPSQKECADLAEKAKAVKDTGKNQGSLEGQIQPGAEPDDSLESASIRSTPVSSVGNRVGQMLEQHSEGQQASETDLSSFFEQWYEKWRPLQLKLREQHLLSKWTRRPSLETVEKFISDSGWTGNCIPAEEVISRWAAPATDQYADCLTLSQRVEQQSWEDLAMSSMPNGGRGVFATKYFTARSVLCDYHGKLESGAEGRRLVAQLQLGQDSYVFFFKFREQEYGINAQAENCVCHPQFTTFGRMINHSSKKDNVKGLVVKMNIQGQDRPVFLIVAKRNLNLGEELLIDYGVTRKSNGGEAMELSWLDD